MSEDMYEKIDVEEEPKAESAEEKGKSWTEEFTVAGEDLMAKVKQLVHETSVRRIVIKNEAKRIHFEIPMVLGLVGIALLPVYSAVALIAALVVDCKILVERVEKEPVTE
ncbi:MAG: DUF4342 domain-containing protein [Ardenticatenaceae bacterium]|nr:DUF4342 domain-containing protein [Ardenticatenaceae bacterium]MCB9444857.1 DUF4342 domain-containing protein [Ardenticatenaceae bacterium]